MSREALLAKTLVQLTEALVDDFDLVDLLTLLSDRCVEILDVSAAGLMLVAAGGDLRRMASSSDAMRILEVFEEESDEGPCPDCYRRGEPVINIDLAQVNGRWPRFAPKALEAGFRSVHALPLHVRGRTIGALNLFRTDEGQMGDADVVVAQALADVATISIVTQRAVAEAHGLNEQLQHALNSRIVIEQAKGIVGQSLGVDMEQAFLRLRAHARSSNLKLGDVAMSVIDNTLPARSLALPRRPPGSASGPTPTRNLTGRRQR
ncbi:MAG: GAF and ANTAR domain-containing protein [Actinomycetota bacterium]|nr:GAF and ANTAR domain-containing protein [Actinomycetota bacterium]